MRVHPAGSVGKFRHGAYAVAWNSNALETADCDTVNLFSPHLTLRKDLQSCSISSSRSSRISSSRSGSRRRSSSSRSGRRSSSCNGICRSRSSSSSISMTYQE